MKTHAITPSAPTLARPAPEVQTPSHMPDSHPFAEMLRQNRQAAAVDKASTRRPGPTTPAPAAAQPARAPESSPEHETKAHEADTESDDAPSLPDPARPPSAAKGKARETTRASSAGPGREPIAKPATNEALTKPDDPGRATTSATVGTDPALAQWIADLHLAPRVRLESASDRRSVAEPEEGDSALGASSGRGAGSAGDAAVAGADDRHAAPDGKDDALATRGDVRVAARFEAFVAAEATPHGARVDEVRRTDPAAPNAPVASAPFNLLSAASLSAPAPVDVPLPSAPGAPDFAQVLGVQVSLLARDGVQTAELHLNPADMGPVSVQIVIDGTQARVDFGADVAATRHAIEAGIPELASALRDAGLTLSGGGVSQHSRGRGEAESGSMRPGSARGQGLDAGAAEPAPAIRTRVQVPGGVDLYA
ncbi:MAG: flagellar hook-length control protein FliK [Caldimonas sp.]